MPSKKPEISRVRVIRCQGMKLPKNGLNASEDTINIDYIIYYIYIHLIYGSELSDPKNRSPNFGFIANMVCSQQDAIQKKHGNRYGVKLHGFDMMCEAILDIRIIGKMVGAPWDGGLKNQPH